MILSDSMNNFQENEEQKVVNKPFYPFYWEMGDTFFSKDAENVYSEMIEQVNKGQRLTIEQRAFKSKCRSYAEIKGKGYFEDFPNAKTALYHKACFENAKNRNE